MGFPFQREDSLWGIGGPEAFQSPITTCFKGGHARTLTHSHPRVHTPHAYVSLTGTRAHHTLNLTPSDPRAGQSSCHRDVLRTVFVSAASSGPGLSVSASPGHQPPWGSHWRVTGCWQVDVRRPAWAAPPVALRSGQHEMGTTQSRPVAPDKVRARQVAVVIIR